MVEGMGILPKPKKIQHIKSKLSTSCGHFKTWNKILASLMNRAKFGLCNSIASDEPTYPSLA